MRYIPYIIIGAILGALHGLVLWASLETLGFPSWFITGSEYTLPIQLSVIVDAVIIITLVSAVWWLPKLERFFLEE